MKMFMACLGTETNTFSPIPTAYNSFSETFLCFGDATRREPEMFNAELHRWRDMAEANGDDVVESLCAFAQPAGPTVDSVYEAFRDRILDDLRQAVPVNYVLLGLHGAMVAQGYDDCEGDLAVRVRELVGAKTIIGMELDLHCHTTAAMTENCDVIITFKEYPHIDIIDRAAELFEVCRRAAAGEIRPVISSYDASMIDMFFTPVEPMKSFVAKITALEGRDDVLSVSIGHGFPWGDVPDMGSKVLVVTDDAQEAGDQLAGELGRELFTMRGKGAAKKVFVEDAVAQALEAKKGPIVLADTADNAGCGAPADSTFIIRELMKQGADSACVGLLYDPVMVALAFDAGEGAVFDMRLGGKMGPSSGDPLDVRATVTKLVRDADQKFGESSAPMGDCAAVCFNGIDVVLNNVRMQGISTDLFTKLGIDPQTRKIIVVKSTQHFYDSFAPIAEEVLYVDSPGALVSDLTALTFTKLKRPKWPLDDDPFANKP